MSFSNPYYVGLGNVGSYQVSGMPYATSSIAAPASSGTPTVVTFPYVTQRIVVTNTTNGSALRVGFSENGAKGTNYFIIPAALSNLTGPPPSVEMKIKVNSIYILSNTATPTSASILAELTNIDSNLLINSGPSGSNWSGSNGVG